MDDGAVFPDGSTAQSGSPRHPASQLRLSLWGLSGGLIGGVLASAFVIAVTAMIKEILGWLTAQEPWLMFSAPFAGILCAVILLHVVAQGKAVQRVSGNAAPPRRLTAWLRFPASAVRADLTADVVRHAGREESFPWRLAPIRAAAIISTVGLGAPMGTESPAAHLGVAAGSAIGARPGWLRSLARPAGLGGGAAGVAVLMGLPLVGLVFILELGHRKQAALSVPRILAAGSGALVGWGFNMAFNLDFIRLVVPAIAPGDLVKALSTAALVGVLSGAVGSITGTAIYQARSWSAGARTKFIVGSAVLLGSFLAISLLASPSAAIGPGAGTISWAEATTASVWVILAVALLRCVATTAAVAAGGVGGLFVPLLAIGDLCGRSLAPALGVSGDLGAAAGAAGAIAGGYRLPLTAIAMVLTVGGPAPARLTCLAAVAVATVTGALVAYLLDRYVLHRKADTSAAH